MVEVVSGSLSNADVERSVTATGSCRLEHDGDIESGRRRPEGDMPEHSTSIAKEMYTVGWVCALPLEMAAARGMLDEMHDDLLDQDAADHNSYLLGKMRGHYVVIACLPAGIYGTTTAATVAKDMLRTFRSIRFGLLVGIGGGTPSSQHDIRLGDIVVSQPTATTGGVVQYDRGKTTKEGHFERTGSLNAPPQVLLNSLTKLQSNHIYGDTEVPYYLSRLPPKMKKKFNHHGISNDYLFQAEYDHIGLASDTCDQCDHTRTVPRKARDDTDPEIHYGLIASGNQVIKDAKTRDRLSKELGGVLCFEMEAAGLQDFPCLVIRGICDYADSHKNKMWQEYAAATAAAFAKELLAVTPPKQVLKEPAVVSEAVPLLKCMFDEVHNQNVRYEIKAQRDCHRVFKTSDYKRYKNVYPDRVPGTCKWVLNHHRYVQWQENPHDGLLWISADPGCGKSVLAKSLISGELKSTDEHTVLYFFFKDSYDQNSLSTALCAVLHQLFHFQLALTRHAMVQFQVNGEKVQKEPDTLWQIFLDAARDDEAKNVTCILDAIDECRGQDRRLLLEFLTSFHKEQATVKRKFRLKFLVTSRPYHDIEFQFRVVAKPNSIRLAGEESNADISEEINLVVKDKVATISRQLNMDQPAQETLQRTLLAVPHRTYLWLYLVIEEVCSSPERVSELIKGKFNTLPTTVEDAYEGILSRIESDGEKARTFLQIVVGARRPLTLSEMDVAFQMATDARDAKTHKHLKLDPVLFRTRIRQLCGLFVFINDDRIYLIHETAKDFLVTKDLLFHTVDGRWKHSFNSRQSDAVLTQICVQYLSFKDIKRGRSSIRGKHAAIDARVFPLLEYAAAHWPAHFRNARSDDKELMGHILDLYNAEDRWFQKHWNLTFGASKHRRLRTCCMSIFHIAALNGHDTVLARLLDLYKTSINAVDCQGCTPLRYGVSEGYDAVVQILLSKGADAMIGTDNVLGVACSRGRQKIVQMLVDNSSYKYAPRTEYRSALNAGVSRGFQEIVQMLLDSRAYNNAPSREYRSALNIAVSRGFPEITEMLLNKGANAKRLAELALFTACVQGFWEVVELVGSQGADVNIEHVDQGTVLQAASVKGHKEMVQVLLDQGVDANVKGGRVRTALQLASSRGYTDVVQSLIDGGASANADDSYALYAAACQGYTEIAEILLEHGADPNAKGRFYGSALVAALAGGHEDVALMLLAYGADHQHSCTEVHI